MKAGTQTHVFRLFGWEGNERRRAVAALQCSTFLAAFVFVVDVIDGRIFDQRGENETLTRENSNVRIVSREAIEFCRNDDATHKEKVLQLKEIAKLSVCVCEKPLYSPHLETATGATNQLAKRSFGIGNPDLKVHFLE